MPPKRRKSNSDIRSFFNKKTVSSGGSSTKSTQAEEVSTSQMDAPHLVTMKEEEEEEEEDFEQGQHSHQFKVKFPNDCKEYTIDCDQTRTVLDAIKSHLNEQFRMMKDKKRNYSDETIIIQLSKKEKTFVDLDLELDYAILELNPNGQKHNQAAETEEAEVPPGLLSIFGPPPKDGEACLIGHPAGAVKKMDPTCIIPIEKREEAVNQNLEKYGDYIFSLYAINQEIRKDPYADIFVTYNTFMYRGASGSPVFDAECRVFGLHTGGFLFDFVKPKNNVIEYAYPLLTIFKNVVGKVKKSGKAELLERIQENAIGNSHLEQIIEELNDEEPMETN